MDQAVEQIFTSIQGNPWELAWWESRALYAFLAGTNLRDRYHFSDPVPLSLLNFPVFNLTFKEGWGDEEGKIVKIHLSTCDFERGNPGEYVLTMTNTETTVVSQPRVKTLEEVFDVLFDLAQEKMPDLEEDPPLKEKKKGTSRAQRRARAKKLQRERIPGL